MITGNDIRNHLPHRVNGAAHLAVCSCGETFRAVPAQASALEVWADHLAGALNVALTGSRGAI